MDGKSQKTEKDFQNQLEYISFKNILPHLRQVNVLEKEKVLLLFFGCGTLKSAKPQVVRNQPSFSSKRFNRRKAVLMNFLNSIIFSELIEILTNFILYFMSVPKLL
jgi:hypothetical protein